MIQKLNAWSMAHPELASSVHTFLATFIVTFLGQLASIPQSAILSPETWTLAAIGSIAAVAIRAAIKTVSPLNV